MILALPIDGRQREAARERLGRRHQVRLHAIMLHGEELAGAAEAGLDFIGDEQDAVLVAERAQLHHQFLRRDVEAAFALHGLDDDGGHALRLHVTLEQQLDAVDRVFHRDALVGDGEGHMPDAGRHGAELGLVGHDLAGERHAQQRAAMEAAVEGDDIRAAGIGAGKLDGVLDGFGTRGDEAAFLSPEMGATLFSFSHTSMKGV
jgi:hypothetical protein